MADVLDGVGEGRDEFVVDGPGEGGGVKGPVGEEAGGEGARGAFGEEGGAVCGGGLDDVGD